jgi:hypothetical protein
MNEPAKDEAALIKLIGQIIFYFGGEEDYFMENAEAALAIILAAGWAVVPVEPTEEMLDIGTSHIFQPGVTWHKCAGDAYRAMIEAAPGVKP